LHPPKATKSEYLVLFLYAPLYVYFPFSDLPIQKLSNGPPPGFPLASITYTDLTTVFYDIHQVERFVAQLESRLVDHTFFDVVIDYVIVQHKYAKLPTNYNYIRLPAHLLLLACESETSKKRLVETFFRRFFDQDRNAHVGEGIVDISMLLLVAQMCAGETFYLPSLRLIIQLLDVDFIPRVHLDYFNRLLAYDHNSVALTRQV